MNRRRFLKALAALSVLLPGCAGELPKATKGAVGPARRVRPGDPSWPSEASWETLRRQVHGRLIEVESPVAACRAAPDGAACAELFEGLKNPYYIRDQPALTQTSGWVGAWTSAPSVYAVAAEETSDVVAAVRFAREHNLRLAVKGGGHSYQGTSCAPDSLLGCFKRSIQSMAASEARRNFRRRSSSNCCGAQACASADRMHSRR